MASDPDSTSDSTSVQRRKSHDDGVRPLSLISRPKSNTQDGRRASDTKETSTVSSSGDKYRAKNPGLVLADFRVPGRSTTAPVLSPSAASLSPRSPNAPAQDPRPYSLPQEQFAQRLSSGTPFATPMSTPSTGDFATRPFGSPTEVDHGAEPQTPISRGRISDASPPSHELDHTTPTRCPRLAAPTDSQSPRSNTRGLGGTPKETVPIQRSLSPGLAVNGQTLHPHHSPQDRPRSFLEARRFSSNPGPDLTRSRSPSKSRPESLAYRADVPRNIESGTDTESETTHSRQPFGDQESNSPTAPLPKIPMSHSPDVSASDIDPDFSIISQANSANGSDEMLESSPVEGTSHSTFIAPALPPIRFSMTSSNFSDLLGAVGGPSLRVFQDLADISEAGSTAVSPTPPSTVSSSDGHRPISDTTVVASPSYTSSQTSLVEDDTTVVLKNEKDNVGVPRSSNDRSVACRSFLHSDD